MLHKYTIDFLRGGKRVDQLLVYGAEPFDTDKALQDHRSWHSRWPEHLRPDEARLAAATELKNFQDFNSGTRGR